MNLGAAEAGPLWAVTSYFNPVGYRRRRQNYRTFREQLAAPLVTVELSFNGRFELEPQDAEILIQIRGQDVMWQKERLLNTAVEALPASCTQVVILDCDVVFVRPDWMAALSRRLEGAPLAQPFSTIHYASPDVPFDSPEALAGSYCRPSVAYLIEQGNSGRDCMVNFTGRGPGTRCTGHAIAARRELLSAHGIYDAHIIGGGDTAFLAAALGAFHEGLAHQNLNDEQIAYYMHWARPFQRDVRGEIACVQGDLVHLWHGEISDRRTIERHHEFAAFGFNPASDIALEPCGCWRWSSDKPAMHEYLRCYFARRMEDGREPSAPSRSAIPPRHSRRPSAEPAGGVQR
jgi:hypothetical protein